jgi:hypothetical protein
MPHDQAGQNGPHTPRARILGAATEARAVREGVATQSKLAQSVARFIQSGYDLVKVNLEFRLQVALSLQ